MSKNQAKTATVPRIRGLFMTVLLTNAVIAALLIAAVTSRLAPTHFLDNSGNGYGIADTLH
jgi:hypothetical protein